MINKINFKILCIFWLIYLIFFLCTDLKLIFSTLGLLGLSGTIFLIKKNQENNFLNHINKLNAIVYSLILIFSIYLVVQTTGLKGFNWLYFLILSIIDHHFFYFVNWTPWKKKKKKIKKEKGKTREWVESVLFAVFAATLIHIFTIQPYIIPTSSLEGTLLRGDFLFVSKFHYGANVPNTPLFLPFMHNTLPFTKNTPSYLDWIQLGYNRLPGFQKIKNNDIVVFNWPTDDTWGTRPNMPFDKKLNYVKRCIAIPGDKLEIKNGDIYINNEKKEEPNRATIQHAYWIQYDNKSGHKSWKEIKKELHNKYNVELQVIAGYKNYDDEKIFNYSDIIVNGSKDEIDFIDRETEVLNTTRISKKLINENDTINNSRNFSRVFPFYNLNKYNQNNSNRPYDQNLITSLFPQPPNDEVIYKEITKNCLDSVENSKFEIKRFEYNSWDNDNYGPISMPKEGEEIELNDSTIAFYADIITKYENNTLEIVYKKDCEKPDSSEYKFFINGIETKKYTIKMDQGYYWMMGDNRHNSQDSRCWGFVPFNHVVGKPLLVWLSIDWNADKLFNKIRWKRLFTTVHGEGNSRWYFPYFLVLLTLFIFRKRLKLIIRKVLNSKNKKNISDQNGDE